MNLRDRNEYSTAVAYLSHFQIVHQKSELRRKKTVFRHIISDNINESSLFYLFIDQVSTIKVVCQFIYLKHEAHFIDCNRSVLKYSR